MKYNEYKNISAQLKEPQKIVLSAHASPDGDTIGSCLALYHYLVQFGHQVKVISPNVAPGFLQWLPSYEHLIIYDTDPLSVKKEIEAAELIFAVDYNAFHRTGKGMDSLLENASATKFFD